MCSMQIATATFVQPAPIVPGRQRLRAHNRLVMSAAPRDSPFSIEGEAHLAALVARARAVRCPFWRRRFTDALEVISATLSWAAATRHKSLPTPGFVGVTQSAGASFKRENLSMENRLRIIAEDFTVRQYYVTGRLSADIYAEDCLFDGPDPDVPVRGLAKYTDATGNLFYRPKSRVDLLQIDVVDGEKIRAHWRLEGALNLPWKPQIKPYTGSTLYTFDERGLVVRHVEEWSISAFDAFVSTLFPRYPFGAQPAPSADVLRRRHQEDGKSYHDR